MGYWVGLACSVCEPVIIACAAGLTFGIFAFLTVFTMILTSFGADFSIMGPLLAQALALMVWSSIANLVWGVPRRFLAGACFGVLLFSLYIIYDTNQIVTRYADDEYIAAAVELYLDVVNLFLKLLELLSKLKGK